MKKRSLWIKIIIGVILLLTFIFLPIPYYIQGPGAIFELDEMVEVDGEYPDEEGNFMMTTVGVLQATPLTSFMTLFPNYDGMSENQMLGEVNNIEAYSTLQEYFMDSSINTSLAVAFEAAGEEVDFNFHGIYVMQIIPESSFYGALEMGDTITSIDGHTFENSESFVDYVSDQEVGQEVSITYQRDGEEHSTSGELIEMPSTGEAGIGIGLVDDTTIETSPEATIHSGEVGGASAGLMYSLQVYSLLENENLMKGYNIAGTGTMSQDGTVGRISGIDKKVVSAADQGADYFLAPDEELTSEITELNPEIQTNYEIAYEKVETLDTDMQVVPVQTFQGAVDFLNQLEPAE